MATRITNPIWKDTYYTTTADSASYKILLDGETIYTGKAVKYPDAETMQINVNKICRNYLTSDIAYLLRVMPDVRESESNSGSQKTFSLYVNDVNVQDYQFYLDYSYTDEMATSGAVVVSKPINGHYVPGMLRMQTTRTSLSADTEMVHSSVYTEADMGDIYDDDDYLGYETQVKCAPYALYYLNSYGGWDAFMIEGTVIKKDNYTTYTTDRVANNTTLEFELNKYVTEINTTYTLNTNYLSDEESANLAKNLIGSIRVYLHNIEEGWVKPVIITDTNVTYQTYQTNGRKLAQYQINVKESRTKIRR